MVAQQVYGGLPMGAGGMPVAAYPASVSAAGGMGGYVGPMQNLPYYMPTAAPVLPQAYAYQTTSNAKGKGQLLSLGANIGGGLVSAAAQPAQMAAGATVKSVVHGLGEVAGPVTGVAMAGVGLVTGNIARKNGVEVMIDGYREVVADQLGISPEAVDEKALRTAAEKNEVIAQALSAYDQGVGKKAAISGTGAVAGLVSGSALAVALGLTTGPLGFIVGAGAGMLTSNLTEKALGGITGLTEVEKTVHGEILQLRGKLETGQALSPMDVFGVHVRMNGKMAENIKELCGKEFHELDANGKAKAMAYYGELTAMANQEAYLVNSGSIKAEMIPFLPMNSVAATMQPAMLPQAGMPAMVPLAEAEPQQFPTTKIAANSASIEPMQQGRQLGAGFASNVIAGRAAAANQGAYVQQA